MSATPKLSRDEFITPQHARDLRRDLLGGRRRVPEQPREDLPRLRHRDRPGFPPTRRRSGHKNHNATRANVMW